MNPTEWLAQHKTASIIGLVLLTLVAAIGVFSRAKKVSPIGWGWFGEINTTASLALAGFDPVSYHEGGPQLGSERFSYQYKNAAWHFVSEDNKNKFSANPDQYMPRAGGFCAFAASKGFTANADPKTFHIEAGKLYVFDSPSVKDSWLAAIPEGAVEATLANWSKR